MHVRDNITRPAALLIVIIIAAALSMAGNVSGGDAPASLPVDIQADLDLALEAYDGGAYGEAKAAWKRGALRGNTDAMTSLANMLQRGEGGERDTALAFQWYQKAARRGDTVGQLNLGDMYRSGIGTTANRVEAMFWLTLAGRSGPGGRQGNAWAAGQARRLATSMSPALRRQIELKVERWQPTAQP